MDETRKRAILDEARHTIARLSDLDVEPVHEPEPTPWYMRGRDVEPDTAPAPTMTHDDVAAIVRGAIEREHERIIEIMGNVVAEENRRLRAEQNIRDRDTAETFRSLS